MGRPTKFTQELADKLCETIASSSDGLTKICKDNGIDYTTVKRWLIDNEKFRTQYARAKEDQADYLADEIIKLADDKSGDMQDGEYGKVGNAANIQRSRLQVDARKWVAAKLKPKKYGDKVELENTGEVKIITANFGNPIIPASPESIQDS